MNRRDFLKYDGTIFFDGQYWRKIEENENYLISNRGSVFNLQKQHYLNPCTMSKSGYKYVKLSVFGGMPKNLYIHRLVARAFLLNPENKPIVHHIDGSRGNNAINNLWWCTAKENHNYGTRGKRICIPS